MTITQTMTVKQRWLAAIDFQEPDCLPFFPKINPAYVQAQAAAWRDKTPADVHRWIGSDFQTWIGPGLREAEGPAGLEEQSGQGTHRTVYKTPEGDLQYVLHFDEPSQSWHPVEHPVKTVEDVRRLTWWYGQRRVELDPEAMDKARAAYERWGQDAVPAVTIGTSPLMCWVEHLAGVENAHFLLADYPEECAALFEAMQCELMRRAELLAAHHPADMLYLMENTSTTLISVDQYRQYNVPQLAAIGEIVAGAGRRLMLHMCGHVKALLPDLNRIPAAGFEAFTAPTLGNAILAEGRRECPRRALIGGTHAMLWLEPVEVIVDFIRARLDELEHHRGLVVSSAGLMPPGCPPEKIKAVCEWVKQYSARW